MWTMLQRLLMRPVQGRFPNDGRRLDWLGRHNRKDGHALLEETGVKNEEIRAEEFFGYSLFTFRL